MILRWLIAALFIGLTLVQAATPTDSTEERRLRVIPVPVVGYAPETKWMGGVYTGIIYHFAGNSRPSSSGVRALFSQRHQIEIGFDPTVYVGAYQIGNETEYLRWPDSFFGIGNNTPADAEESYTARVIGTDVSVRHEWQPCLWAGVRYKYEHVKLTATETSGLLASGSLPTPTAGTTSGAGVTASYDSRDNIFFPTGGLLYGGSATFFGPALGSDFRYAAYSLDFRNYFSVYGSHVFAGQVAGYFTDDHPHFRHYPEIGGENKMRGYNAARYRDRQSVYAQAEYRFPVWWRFRATLFGGVGDVAAEIGDFAPGKFKHTIGGGLRFLAIAKEKIYIRLDYGVGIHSDGYYLAVNEAF